MATDRIRPSLFPTGAHRTDPPLSPHVSPTVSSEAGRVRFSAIHNKKGRPPNGRTSPSPAWKPAALLVLQVRQQPQDLQVQPDQGHHETESHVPRELGGHSPADGL